MQANINTMSNSSWDQATLPLRMGDKSFLIASYMAMTTAISAQLPSQSHSHVIAIVKTEVHSLTE
jgi:hypothetical protein